jgi:hypothetical protein
MTTTGYDSCKLCAYAIDMIQTARLSLEKYHRIVGTGILRDRQLERIEGLRVELSPETPYHANQNNKVYKYLLLFAFSV